MRKESGPEKEHRKESQPRQMRLCSPLSVQHKIQGWRVKIGTEKKVRNKMKKRKKKNVC